ncbi:MAG: deoxyguanosinetriphosphate triphosphohydrolase [Lachnospiraceae bacterium]|jgi:deoxyguanosinetriphosphate triphosphohydrolase, putative|nr:deoxyguanosinetriphosphate triphosphohydrolase [Lachnospiraceae bacterium]
MEWKKLLSQTRLVEEEKDPSSFNDYYISPFERDYERIVSSAAFRRLQDKTQVFPLAKSDFVRTRLTHSIEVSTIAKQLGIMCFQNTSAYPHFPVDYDEENDERLKLERVADVNAILSCAGLLHDLGNPPFGHVGEEIIRDWFKDNLRNVYLRNSSSEKSVSEMLNEKHIKDLENFEGNAQAFRILSKARHQSEINLPYSILSALIKYPTRCDETGEAVIRHKIGCYQAEEKTFMQIAEAVGTINTEQKVIRHPLAYIVEAADDIAYMTADLEDAVKSGVVSVEELLSYFRETYLSLAEKRQEPSKHIARTKEIIDKLDDINKAEEDKTKVMSQWGTYLRKWLMYVVCWRFSVNYDDILNGTFENDLFYDNNHSLTAKLLKKAMAEFVFDSRIIIEPEVSAQTILTFLLDKFVPALVRFDDNGEMTTQDKKVITLVSQNYIDDYKKAVKCDSITDKEELLYRRILIATDFISGMTDGYAKTLYKKMSGLE